MQTATTDTTALGFLLLLALSFQRLKKKKRLCSGDSLAFSGICPPFSPSPLQIAAVLNPAASFVCLLVCFVSVPQRGSDAAKDIDIYVEREREISIPDEGGGYQSMNNKKSQSIKIILLLKKKKDGYREARGKKRQ